MLSARNSVKYCKTVSSLPFHLHNYINYILLKGNTTYPLVYTLCVNTWLFYGVWYSLMLAINDKYVHQSTKITFHFTALIASHYVSSMVVSGCIHTPLLAQNHKNMLAP